MSAVEERSYVEEARREKRAALEARGHPGVRLPVRAHAHGGRRRAALYREEMEDQGPRRRESPAGIVALRSPGQDQLSGISRTRSAKIQLYFRQDELGDAV